MRAKWKLNIKSGVNSHLNKQLGSAGIHHISVSVLDLDLVK